MSEERFLFTKEAVKHIGASVHVLRKYITKGLVPAHKLGERLLEFDPVELDDTVKLLTRVVKSRYGVFISQPDRSHIWEPSGV